MKLSKRRQNDLESIVYFMPSSMKNIPITERDIEMFFENSEQGKHKDKIGSGGIGGDAGYPGLNALIEGKRWRGIHMHEMYESGVLQGIMPYFVILGCGGYGPKVLVSVKDFMKKEMFRGVDGNLIEEIYNTDYGDIL
jgi:hypothetical protein